MISLDFGVAVNVFWKHLDDSFYDPRDTYGNKDHCPFSRAQQIVDRALKALDELPEDYKQFYAQRLISRIQTKVFSANNDSTKKVVTKHKSDGKVTPNALTKCCDKDENVDDSCKESVTEKYACTNQSDPSSNFNCTSEIIQDCLKIKTVDNT